MASGKVHYMLWKKYRVAAPVFGLLTCTTMLAAGGSTLVAAVVGVSVLAGYGLGKYLTPDSDLIGITTEESRSMRDLKILGVFLTMWFLIYAYIMRFVGIGRKGHRNFFSHFPGVSSFIRQRWLFLGSDIIVAIYGSSQLLVAYLIIMGGMLIGQTLADTLHYLADILPSQKVRSML